MTNICTKVTVRKRPIKNGQTSLYLDFYPPIRNPKTGKLSRREYLGLYIYTNPVERFQQEYNKSMIQKAEIIKCRRTESIINEEYGFLDRNKGKESFLEYFKNLMIERGSSQNWQPPTCTSTITRMVSAASATLPFRTARDSSTTCCRMPVCTTASA